MAEKTVSERLQGLSKAQLREVAKEVGAYAPTKSTKDSLARSIEAGVYRAGRTDRSKAQAADNFAKPADRGAVATAFDDGKARQTAALDKAIEKVRAAAPAKAPKAPRATKASNGGLSLPSAGSARQTAMAKFKAELGHDAPKSWPTGKIEGLPRKLKMLYGADAKTVYAGSVRGASKEARAASEAAHQKSVDDLVDSQRNRNLKPSPAPSPTTPPADAYRQKFGYSPPSGMSDAAADRWTKGPFQAAPGGSSPEQSRRAEARKAYNQAGGTDQRGRMFEALSGQPRVTSDARTTSAKVNTGMAAVGTGVAAGRAFQEAREGGASIADAAMSAGVTAAPGVAMMAGKPVGTMLSKAGSGMMSAGGGLIHEGMGMTGLFTDFLVAKMGMAVGAAGAVAKVAGEGLKVASKVAGPAMVGFGAYQGAKEDTASPTRGAVRGALRSLDPSAIVMKRGIVEQGFDAIAGRAGETRTASKGPGMSMAVASAAPASSFGSSRGPAAPESSKSRTDPYTDSLGRNYANGRLIVRDK